MQFHVGPYIYRVWVSVEPILDGDDEPLLGQALFGNREILIAASVRPEHRLDVLLHELRHCWLFHFPRPRTEEEDCNFSAAVMAQAAADLEEQGGIAALTRVRPVRLCLQSPTHEGPELDAAIGAPGAPPAIVAEDGPRLVPACYVQQTDTAASPHGGRAQCGICETVVASGMIVSTTPRWSMRYGGLVMNRVLYCPHCNHLQTWIEGADKFGSPNGSVPEGPHYQRGRPVEEFLSTHPQAAGIIAE